MPRNTRAPRPRASTPPAAAARQAAATTTTATSSSSPATGTLVLSPAAAALVAKIESEWELLPAVRALLHLAGEALTKAQECESITAREGMTIADQKGSAKPHPMALLARDYRGQASGALQRLLNHLER